MQAVLFYLMQVHILCGYQLYVRYVGKELFLRNIFLFAIKLFAVSKSEDL